MLPLVLPLLAIPALEAVGTLPRPAVLVIGLAAVFVVEAVQWQVVFQARARTGGVFEAQIEPVISAAFAHGGTVYA